MLSYANQLKLIRELYQPSHKMLIKQKKSDNVLVEMLNCQIPSSRAVTSS